MLQREITPFADAHIDRIIEIQKELTEFVASAGLSHHQDAFLLALRDKLYSTREALTRFKVCAEDEWKQKTRYEKYAKEHGYPYS